MEDVCILPFSFVLQCSHVTSLEAAPIDTCKYYIDTGLVVIMATKRPAGDSGGAPPPKRLALGPIDIGPASGEEDLNIKVLQVETRPRPLRKSGSQSLHCNIGSQIAQLSWFPSLNTRPAWGGRVWAGAQGHAPPTHTCPCV